MADVTTQTPPKVDDQLPKAGSISPLEGELGPQIMTVAKICYMGMNLGMCQNLAMAAGNALTTPLMSGSDLAELKAPPVGQQTPQRSAPGLQTEAPAEEAGQQGAPQRKKEDPNKPADPKGQKPKQPAPETPRGYGGVVW